MSYPSLSVKLPVPSGTYAIVSFSRDKVFIFSPLSRCRAAGNRACAMCISEKYLFLYRMFLNRLTIQLIYELVRISWRIQLN